MKITKNQFVDLLEEINMNIFQNKISEMNLKISLLQNGVMVK